MHLHSRANVIPAWTSARARCLMSFLMRRGHSTWLGLWMSSSMSRTIDDPREALVQLTRPGGWLLVTVPAHQALWGSHDRRLHHRRRYGRDQLLDLFSGLDVQLERVTPFNIALSPLAAVYRVGERALGLDLGNQERIPPRALNRVLASAFSSEAAFVRRRLPIPFGLSYAAIYRRPR